MWWWISIMQWITLWLCTLALQTSIRGCCSTPHTLASHGLEQLFKALNTHHVFIWLHLYKWSVPNMRNRPSWGLSNKMGTEFLSSNAEVTFCGWHFGPLTCASPPVSHPSLPGLLTDLRNQPFLRADALIRSGWKRPWTTYLSLTPSSLFITLPAVLLNPWGCRSQQPKQNIPLKWTAKGGQDFSFGCIIYLFMETLFTAPLRKQVSFQESLLCWSWEPISWTAAGTGEACWQLVEEIHAFTNKNPAALGSSLWTKNCSFSWRDPDVRKRKQPGNAAAQFCLQDCKTSKQHALTKLLKTV